MSETGLVKREESSVLAVSEMRQQVNLIQGLMKDMMHDGEHFGVIPGCKKPSLLKPGAEKLSMMFRLAPAYDITQTDLMNNHREYRVKCTITHQSTGRFVGEGVGCCSSMETKFRYRPGYEVTDDPIPQDYKVKKAYYKERGYGCKEIDGQWKWVHFIEGGKQENLDIADTYNTILKMAKKRAHVDAVLSATAASDIFTQDIEDLPHTDINRNPTATPPTIDTSTSAARKINRANHAAKVERDFGSGKEDETPADYPTEEAQGETPPPPPPQADTRSMISEKQGKRLYAIACKANVSMENLKIYLKEVWDIEHSKDIPRKIYDEVCAWAEAGGQEPGR